MYDRPVLNIGGLAYHDAVHVAAQNGAVPHTDAGAQRHITQHAGAGRDERGGINLDYCLRGTNRYCTHASTASPFFWAGCQRRFLAISIA